MASGGLLGAQALASWGWMGVVGVATIASLAAFLVRVRAASAKD
jgi:hypothetical protein